MWRREAPLDRDTVGGIIRMLMQIDAKIDDLLEPREEDDASEEDS